MGDAMSKQNNYFETLQAALNDRSACIGVVGLGYVGLPLALHFVEAGFSVLGFDIDEERVAALRNGESYVLDIDSALVAAAVESGRFHATTDMDRLGESSTISICVPTPLRKTRDPDMSFIRGALDQIATHLRAGQLIVLESTSYPGTTEELLVPMVETAGFEVGSTVFVASSPERVDPANAVWTIANTPKIVGGVTDACTELCASLYGTIVEQIVRVGRPITAELTKLMENTFRSVNIGLANEMALICQGLGVDVWEVTDAAATKPFGYMPFYPGPGIGGHCIPVDPLYLSWKMRGEGAQARFIDLADDINRSMPRHVVSRISGMLNHRGLAVRAAQVLILGVAYKKNVSDVRESPAVDVMTELVEQGASIKYHDPHVDTLMIGDQEYGSVELSEGSLRQADLVVILTDHESFVPNVIVEHSQAIFDARNLTTGIRSPKIERL